MRVVAILAAVALAMVALAGCNTTALDQFFKKNGPQACANASSAYSVYLASGPSAKELAKVNAYYQPIHDLCMDPSQITTQQVAIVVAQAYAMKKAMK